MLDRLVIDRQGLNGLIKALRARGYTTIGPVVRDAAIMYEEIESVADLPEGWTDKQERGYYRLQKRGDNALFGYVVGPHSWKRFLHPPQQRLWSAKRTEDGFRVVENKEEPPKYAFLGVRGCELSAMNIQDRVFASGDFIDINYLKNRRRSFIIAVNCTQAGGTCFCASMETGPQVKQGFDLALTELLGSSQFLLEVGSKRGESLLTEIESRAAEAEEIECARQLVEQTRQQMGRSLDTTGLKELLYSSYDSSRWEDVASRCLTCANCTMVCPTCFCTTVEDRTDLEGNHAERWRRWDSCFTMEFSYIHGGSVRSSVKSRYRQWMTHKLATWIDQFGTSGCVGCGRCITWCPVGIDITEEASALRRSQEVTDGDS